MSSLIYGCIATKSLKISQKIVAKLNKSKKSQRSPKPQKCSNFIGNIAARSQSVSGASKCDKHQFKNKKSFNWANQWSREVEKAIRDTSGSSGPVPRHPSQKSNRSASPTAPHQLARTLFFSHTQFLTLTHLPKSSSADSSTKESVQVLKTHKNLENSPPRAECPSHKHLNRKNE